MAKPTSEGSSRGPVASLDEWLRCVDLESVQFDAVNAVRVGSPADDRDGELGTRTGEDFLGPETSGGEASVGPEKEPEASAQQANIGLSCGFRGDRKKFRVLVQLSFENKSARYRVHVVCYYALHRDAELPDDVRDEFFRLTVMPTVVPYLREALSSLAGRLDIPRPHLSVDFT